MFRRRYLFFDIDGTLAAGGYGRTSIPESTTIALEKLRAAGHFLCIATGRSQAMAVEHMHQLGFENMVSDGGYGITLEGKLWGIEPLPHDKMVALVRECDELGFPWGLQVDNTTTRLVPDGRFAEVTGDRQWIHVDPERAATGPYGATVAHGFLTLSMLGVFSPSAFRVGDVKMGINYGLEKVRFPAPVRVGSQVRARYTLRSMEPIAPVKGLRGYEIVMVVTVDIAGTDKPACVAEYVSRRYH